MLPRESLVWCCPRCRSELAGTATGAKCTDCAAAYERIGGVLDLRVPEASSYNCDADVTRARELLAKAGSCSAHELLQHIFSPGDQWSDEWSRERKRRVLDSVAQHRRELSDWLRPCLDDHAPFLELGCGTGTLLVAGLTSGLRGIGIDASLTLLILARRMILESGHEPTLAAAFAEAIPLSDRSVSGVISLDVIEHVDDTTPYLQEIDRVTQHGGAVALSTPNRFSFTAEPHVGVWGVGWLPRRFQKRYVRWRSGKDYTGTRLLSTWQAKAMIRRCTQFDPRILIPKVAREDIAAFSPRRAMLARIYNRLASWRFLRFLFLLICPFFRVTAIKR